MLMVFPAQVTPGTQGTTMVRFPDVPEAITVVDDLSGVVTWARDALIVALSGYLDTNRAIPSPSRVKSGDLEVVLPPIVAAKLAIHSTMIERGVSRVALATRLGWDEKQVRRLLDLDHPSRMDQVESALTQLGKMIVVEIREAVST